MVMVLSLSLRYTTIKPPPPKFPALGNTTAKAKPVATAASTAFPPFLSISAPTLLADCLCETTIPV